MWRAVRLGVDLVEEATAVLLGEDARESPGLIGQRLHVLDVDHKHIARFRGFNLKRTTQVVDFGEVDILDVVGGIVILDLAAGPIHTLDLHRLAVLDRFSVGWYYSASVIAALEGDGGFASVLSGCQRF